MANLHIWLRGYLVSCQGKQKNPNASARVQCPVGEDFNKSVRISINQVDITWHEASSHLRILTPLPDTFTISNGSIDLQEKCQSMKSVLR